MSETLTLLHSRGQQATGSLQSWHANEYDVKGDPPHIPTLPNITEGILPLFPRLDVMPGAASAYNDGMDMAEWRDYISETDNLVSNPNLDFEIQHGALQGFKLSTSNLGYEVPPKWPGEFSLFNRAGQEPVANDKIDHSIAEGRETAFVDRRRLTDPPKPHTDGTRSTIPCWGSKSSSTSTATWVSRVSTKVRGSRALLDEGFTDSSKRWKTLWLGALLESRDPSPQSPERSRVERYGDSRSQFGRDQCQWRADFDRGYCGAGRRGIIVLLIYIGQQS